MLLQENTLFDLGLGINVTQNATSCDLHFVVRRYIYKKIHFLTLTWSHETLPSTIHHVTYAPAKFEVARF